MTIQDSAISGEASGSVENSKTQKQNDIKSAIFDVSMYGLDRRRKYIRRCIKDHQMTPEQLLESAKIHENRFKKREILIKNEKMSLDKKVMFLHFCKTAELNFEACSSRTGMTGIDWTAYHRPSSNGIGWVLIAPDEPGNNWYTDDKVLVKFLTKKYL